MIGRRIGDDGVRNPIRNGKGIRDAPQFPGCFPQIRFLTVPQGSVTSQPGWANQALVKFRVSLIRLGIRVKQNDEFVNLFALLIVNAVNSRPVSPYKFPAASP